MDHKHITSQGKSQTPEGPAPLGLASVMAYLLGIPLAIVGVIMLLTGVPVLLVILLTAKRTTAHFAGDVIELSTVVIIGLFCSFVGTRWIRSAWRSTHVGD